MANYYLQHGAYVKFSYTIQAVSANSITLASSLDSSISQNSTFGVVVGGILYTFPYSSWVGGVVSGIVPNPAVNNLSATAPFPLLVEGMTVWFYGQPAISPTFGTTQEGDGLSTGLAVCATVQIDMSAMTVGSSGAIGVLGASVPISSGSTAASVAASINASTTPITAPANGWNTPPLKNAVYATSTGNILKIQTRGGSSIYNGKQITAANITGWPGVNPSFSGGVSGCWGYLCNSDEFGSTPQTMWPSGITYAAYTPYSSSLICGPKTTGQTDTVFVRGGTNDYMAAIYNYSKNTYWFNVSGAGCNIIVDNGTYWTGDTNCQFSLRTEYLAYSGGYSHSFGGYLSFSYLFFGAMPGASLLIQENVPISTMGPNNNGKLVFENAKFIDRAQVTSVPLLAMGTTYSNVEISFVACTITSYRTSSTWVPITIYNASGNSSYGSSVTFDNCTFNMPAMNSPVFLFQSSICSYSQIIGVGQLKIRNCNVSSPVQIILLNALSVLNQKGVTIQADNISGNVSLTPTGLFCNTSYFSTYLGDAEYGNSVVLQGIGQTRQVMLETPVSLLTWRLGSVGSSDLYPTANAYQPLPDGTPWSWRFMWVGTSQIKYIKPTQNGTEQVQLTKTIISTSGLTGICTVNLLVPPTESLVTNQQLGMVLTYFSATQAKYVTIQTAPPLSDFFSGINNTVLPADTTTDWNYNSYASYLPRKLSVTLPDLPAENTEVVASIRVYGHCSQIAAVPVFVNPIIEVK